jgi:hypothetical protein
MSKKTKKGKGLEEALRQQIATSLPQAIEKALSSYHDFVAQSVPDDAKGFSSHHGAAKIAITHIELLLKLAHWAQLPDDNIIDPEKSEELTRFMELAQQDLDSYKYQESEVEE